MSESESELRAGGVRVRRKRSSAREGGILWGLAFGVEGGGTGGGGLGLVW